MNKEDRPYLYTNTNWYDYLEYNGITWINIDRFENLQQRINKVIELLETTEIVNNEDGTILLKDCDYMDEVISTLKGENND